MRINHGLIGGLDSGPAIIATFSYNDLGYQSMEFERHASREDVVRRLLALSNEGQVSGENKFSTLI